MSWKLYTSTRSPSDDGTPIAIAGFVAGDTITVRITVQSMAAALTKAWMTVKRYAAQADGVAALQKAVTTVDVPGTGQIETAGSSSVSGIIRFDLTTANTLALGSSPWVYDIQIKDANGGVYTIQEGTIQLTAGVTDTTT